MASRDTDVTLRIKADLEQARAALKRIGADIGDLDTKSKKADTSLDKMGSRLRTLAVAAGVGTAIRAIFSATIESETALAQLDARLKSTGGSAGLSREQLIAMAQSLQQVTTFSDEAVLGAEAIIAKFTRIGADIFPQVVKAALDVAAATGKSLPEAANQLGIAFNNPIRGMKLLQQVGAQFTTGQKELIKAMTEAGQIADVQRIFLEALGRSVGGTAEKLRDTLGGALTALKNAFDDLLEGDTGPSGLKKDIESLTQVLQDPATKQGMQSFNAALLAMSGFAVSGTAAIAGLTGRVVAAFQGPKVGDFLFINNQIAQTEKRLAALQARAKEAPFDKIVAGGVEKAKAKLAGLNELLQKSVAETDAAVGKPKSTPGADPSTPPPEVNKKFDDLLARLREQAALQGQVGEAAKVRYAIENGQLGQLDDKQKALLLKYAQQIDAQKQSADAAKQNADAAKALAKEQEGYVAGLEKTAATIGLTKAEAAAYELAEKNLGVALRARAEAALAAIAADEKKRQADADAKQITELQVELLRAQGREIEAATIEAEQRFGELRARLAEAGDTAGADTINQLVRIGQAQARLRELQAQVDAAFAEQTRGEVSIQAQREAGLISEIGARREIVDLHQKTAAELEKLIPEMEALAAATGDPAAIARVQKLHDELGKLKVTSDATLQALRTGFESGLTRAFEGLIDGTLTLRGALNALLADMARAFAQLAAQSLAQEATAGLTRLFGGKDPASAPQGAELVTGAAAVSGSAIALSAAGHSLVIGAAAINEAAIALAGANGTTTGGAGGLAGLFGSLFSSGATTAASGGHITGPGTSTSDSIPARLSNNEFVTRAAVVTQPGALDFLHDFNRRGLAALEHWSRHATGGLAGLPAPAFPIPDSLSKSTRNERGGGKGGNVHVLNFIDRDELLKAAMATPAGDRFVINAVMRNKRSLGMG